jgi:hypothetical protein
MESRLLNRIRTGVSVKLTDAFFLLLLTVQGFVVMGYHPGLEDDGVYLSAVKFQLQPDLYPHDSEFFRLQLQASIFDQWMAGFVRVTGIPVAWAELIWQFLSLHVILWAAHRIARQLFAERRAQWAGVAVLSAMFTLPVAGAAINLADQHLHPRNMASALILLAVDRTLARRPWQAVPLLLAALLMHPIMAVFGMSLCMFLGLVLGDCVSRRLFPHSLQEKQSSGSLAAAVPLGWIFEPPTSDWRRALGTRTYYFLYKWAWYEWLGAIAPMGLFWLLRRYALRRGDGRLARFALALLLYGIFQQSVAMVVLAPAALIRITPLQPMRYLHLVYIFMALIGGCLAGRHILHRSIGRWAVLLIAVNGGMFAAQRAMFGSSRHLELPGRPSNNAWLQAFSWIRENTPREAYFALDPNYLAARGEGFHSFRALAERSQMADAIKDAAVVTQVPELGSLWAAQVDAQAGWSRFRRPDFGRLHEQFGIDWVLVSYPQPDGLTCRWHNERLAVCQIPGVRNTNP